MLKNYLVKSDIISNIMDNILILSSLGKFAEASRYELSLNKLIEDGEVYEFNLLEAIKRDIRKYRE